MVEYVRCGRGAILVVDSPWSLSNSGLSQRDNLPFVLNAIEAFAARGGWVGFDEYHQGYGEFLLWALAQPALKGAVGVLLLAAILFMIAVGPRLGAPLPSPEPVARTRDEYLTSMSGLLERAGASELALQECMNRFCDRAGVALGIGRARQADEVIRAAQQQGNAATEDIERVISACRNALAGGRIDEQRAVAIAREMHDTLDMLWERERSRQRRPK